MKGDLRQRRLDLQKVIADALREQNNYYCRWVQPNAADAGLHSSAPKDAHAGVTKPLSTDEADRLDRDTPTGAFEYGRAFVAHYDAIVRKHRKQLEKVELELARARTEAARRALSERGVAASEEHLPSLFAERLAAFRSLVEVTRSGDQVLQGEAS